MRKRIVAIALMILGIAGAIPVVAGDITFVVENPISNSNQVGVSTIRGWAISTVGIDRVELKVNGDVDSDLPYGGRRDDIGEAFPAIPDSDLSGFSTAYAFSRLDPVLNQMTLTAFDNDGDKKTVVVTFVVSKFQQDFFLPETPLSLIESVFFFAGDDVVIANANMLGERYALRMGWDRRSQNLTIQANAPASYNSLAQDGMWPGLARPDTARNVNNLVCSNVEMRTLISNGVLSGDAVDSQGIVYVISGAVGPGGLITNGAMSSGGQAAITFEGSVTEIVMGGSWNGILGCAGRWFGIQQ